MRVGKLVAQYVRRPGRVTSRASHLHDLFPALDYLRRICVDDFDADRIAERMRVMGLKPTVDRNPANRTSGGDQLYFTDPDNTRVQLGPSGYQG